MDYPALSFDDPRFQGMLGLASGFLQAGGASQYPVGLGQAFGQGLQGMQQGYQSAQKMKQQQALVDLETQKGKLAAEQVRKLQEQQNFAQQILARFKQNPQPPNAAAGATQGGPWAQGYQPPGAPQGAPAGGQRPQFPINLGELMALHASGGPDLLPYYKEGQPNISAQGGFLIDPREGVVGTVPQTNQQGFSTQPIPDKNAPGGFRIQQVVGGNEAYQAQQDIGERTRARYDVQKVDATSPTAQPTFRSRLELAGGGGPGAGGGAPQAAGMSPMNVASQAASAEQQKIIAENFGKQYNELQNTAMAAPSKIAKLERIGTLLGDFEGGKLSKSAMALASAANSAGVRIDPRLPNKEAAEAMSSEFALELRNTANGGGMPGSMSNADRDYLKGMSPNVAMTAKGRNQIIEAKIELLKREGVVAGMARKYREKYGKIDEDFHSQLQEWSNRNPIFK